MSALEELGARYLQVRRAMGFKLVQTERVLNLYLRFLDDNHHPTQSLKNTLEWAGTASSPYVQGHWIGVVRIFVKWAQAFDPRLELVPEHLMPVGACRAIPYIYTPEQVAALMGQAAGLPQSYRAATYWTLLGLLSCTGMRVGEALRLEQSDVRDGLIHINASKFGKSRVIPIDPGATTALENYGRLRAAKFPRALTDAFFVSLSGTPLIYKNVQITVQRLLQAAGVDPISQRHRPRIHDHRHAFATHTIRDAYLTGQDPARILPILSTYLGHASIQATYWYLEAEPGLLNAAASRLPSLLEPIGGTP